MDKRLFEIEHWLQSTLPAVTSPPVPASSDASFRRYFRVWCGEQSYIVMDAPPDKEDTTPFVAASDALAELGLNVPRVLARSESRGILLLDDLGTRLYLDELNEDSADRLYAQAIDSIHVLQQGHQRFPGRQFPAYDAQLLEQEMGLFEQWYVGKHLACELERTEAAALASAISNLTAAALEQPRCWVHRDYHSRNLMVTDENNPGIIDFQDMVIGPISYDLVSLLKDCYIRWPHVRVRDWIDYYLRGTSHDREEFIRWFDLMGVQRHLKVLGIFARLNYRDGKDQYLGDLPMVLDYLFETTANYPELSGLHELLGRLHPDYDAG